MISPHLPRNSKVINEDDLSALAKELEGQLDSEEGGKKKGAVDDLELDLEDD